MTDDPRVWEVLRFWYGAPPGPRFTLGDTVRLPARLLYWGGKWGRVVFDVDAEIGRRFGSLLREAADGALDGWTASPEGRLALILLLDQFPRNVHRGTADAFRQDALARRHALDAIEAGEDQLVHGVARAHYYLPLMHHEDLASQERCIELLRQALRGAGPVPRLVLLVETLSGYRHRQIIARFGRFPHRNQALGRASTAEELRFLRQPLSSF